MSGDSFCPNPEVLKRLMLGQLPKGEAETLEDHLTECGFCNSRVDRLPAEDALVLAMRTRSPILETSLAPWLRRPSRT